VNDMTVRPKSEYHDKMKSDMEKFLRGPDWTPAQCVALSCCILDADGHESALAGQITLRGEKPGTYWGPVLRPRLRRGEGEQHPLVRQRPQRELERPAGFTTIASRARALENEVTKT